MNLSQKPVLNLRINKKARRSVKTSGPIRINETASERQTGATKMADRLVIACRENVRFMNFHLQKYSRYLELPSLVENALYLAYTIRVKEDSPVDALSLRKHLADGGIETSPCFSFVASSEGGDEGKHSNRIAGITAKSNIDTRAFCLGCHQYITILDLEHMVKTFDSIFIRYSSVLPSKPDDNRRRDNN